MEEYDTKSRRFPSEILPGKLYLGDMKHAKNIKGLEELGVSFILSIFNERPELRVDARTMDWLFIEVSTFHHNLHLSRQSP